MLVEDGYRLGVGIILANESGNIFWGRRIGHDAWQFPQGGINEGETPEETVIRELYEEIGLEAGDVEIIGSIKGWLYYALPKPLIRKERKPFVVGQKQKWFLLKLINSEQKIRLDLSPTPEFDSWRWVNYWYPTEQVVDFKQEVYRLALKELEPLLEKL